MQPPWMIIIKEVMKQLEALDIVGVGRELLEELSSSHAKIINKHLKKVGL